MGSRTWSKEYFKSVNPWEVIIIYREFNPNPKGRAVGDCAVRALCAALDVDWDTAYAMLASEGYIMKDMPSSDAVWGSVLIKNGFAREACPECREGYNADEFLKEHNTGKYVIAFGGHVAAADNGILLDSWDSENEIPIYYYKKV